MDSLGKYESKAWKYSWFAPGPPWSKRTFLVGLFPTLLVHTLNVPSGVLMGITFMPPDSLSERLE